MSLVSKRFRSEILDYRIAEKIYVDLHPRCRVEIDRLEQYLRKMRREEEVRCLHLEFNPPPF